MNKLIIALFVFFMALFAYKAITESISDSAAMRAYNEDIKLHPYQHDYVPISPGLENGYYKDTTALTSQPVKK